MDYCDPDLMAKAECVGRAVQIILSPHSNPNERTQAQGYYDRVCASHGPAEMCNIGFIMLGFDGSAEVKHTGLKFIHDSIKYHWGEIPPDKRSEVREMFLVNLRMNLALDSGASAFSAPHMQESFAKGIVEICKKEWPQHWTNFIEQMTSLSAVSNIPLLVLRRLVEDVISLDTVDSQERRTELMQALGLSANELLKVIFNTLKDAFTRTKDNEICRRVNILLNLITAYFEFVNTSLVLADDRIPCILNLLKYKEFQASAMEAIQQVMDRKGTKKEADVPREFLKAISCECILTSISTCEKTNETDQDFLYKLGEVLSLVALTAQITSEDEINNFRRCVITLATHGDVRVQGLAAAAFTNMIKNVQRMLEPHPDIKSTEDLISIITSQFLQPPKPTEKVETAVLKQHFVNLLRAAAKLNTNFYTFVRRWYHECLQSKTTVPAHQWEVIAFIIDAVASCVPNDSDELVKLGRDDFREALLRLSSETDPTTKSAHLSIVSALFVFLKATKDRGSLEEEQITLMMENTFTLIFGMFLHGPISDAQIALRNHAAALLVKLALKFPDLLSSIFDTLSNLLSQAMPNMRNMEIQYTMECFFIISNTWKDFGRQKVLVERVLETDTWVEMEVMLQSPEAFLAFFLEAGFQQRKTNVSRNLHLLMAALRRVQNIVINGTQEKVHAAYDACVTLLPLIFQLIKMFYYIIESPQFYTVVDLTEAEKSQVMGIMFSSGAFPQRSDPSENQENENSYRASVIKFVRSSLELSYGILGLSCLLFTPKLYTIPNMQDLFLNSVGWKLDTLPDYRVRNIVRIVYRPFMEFCPKTNQTAVLLPFLQALCPYMYKRVCDRWNAVQQAALNNVEGDEDREILEAATLRLLTREYIDAIHCILEGSNQKKDSLKQLGQNENAGDMDVDINEDEGQGGSVEKPKSQSNLFALCEFGAAILRDPTCFEAIVHFCGMGLSWDDSAVTYRAARCLIMCFDHVAMHPNLVVAILLNALSSICHWAENEAAKEILARLIDLIHKKFQKQDTRINQMMLEWGASEDDLKKLSGSASEGQKNDKIRKDIIRRMIKNSPAVGLKNTPKTSWLELPKLRQKKENMEADPQTEELNECFSLVDTVMP